jgi:DNA-binding MarR family transcriptional regulator
MTDLFSYPASPGYREPTTSRDAAHAMHGSAKILRDRVLAAFKREEGTSDEIADRLGESILSVRPRVTELSRMNLIERTGERRHNASGMSAHVWRAKGAAHHHDSRTIRGVSPPDARGNPARSER